MSLLGNHNNDFEKKLKKHLGDTEYKPAESLWDRIDKEVNKPEFEQKVEGKIGRYELKPKPETWEYIEAHLPPEPKSWRRAGKVWYSLIALLFFGGAFLGYQLNTATKQVVAIRDQSIALDASVKDAPADNARTITIEETKAGKAGMHPEKETRVTTKTIASNPVEKIFAELVSPVRAKEKTASPDNRTQNIPTHSFATAINQPAPVVNATGRTAAASSSTSQAQAGPDSGDIPGKTTLVSMPVVKDETAGTSVKGAKSTGKVPENAEPASLPEQHQADLANKNATEKLIPAGDKSAGMDTISKAVAKTEGTGKPVAQLSDSAINTIAFTPIDAVPPVKLSISIMTGMHQSNMRLIAPAGMEQNKALREKVETPEWDFTGGFLLDYKVNDRVLISSGIILTGFSMGMSYNTLPSNRSASLEPGATYENSTDSIVPGTVINSRIKYSWSEIPLFVTYKFKTKKRFGVAMRAGISYAIIGTVDAAMVGQDNIGVLAMKTQESFPVFQNSVFLHLYAGLSYRLNETVSLCAMPYTRYSINSMVKTERWIQQHPWMTGLSLGLRKSF